MEHNELVQEMTSIERMSAQERLKHAKKRRIQQLKKWNQYDKQFERDSTKKPKRKGSTPQSSIKKPKRQSSNRVQFVANIALLESAARSDLEEVRRLLESGVNPDVTNEDGLTALHQCCIDDNEDMLKLLLDFNANVNACDSEMWTPLHAAATCGHVTLCKHLIDRGAKLLAVNADGNMPYDICEDEVTLDYIESEMAKRGITQEQIDETRLTTERQMLKDLKEYAGSGGDLEVQDASGTTMLHIAAANGYLEVADFLLDHHVNVDGRDSESWQPIHAAAYWGQLDILEMLVQNGADLDSKTKNGETPFDLSEDPDIKQRILDLKDEIETNRASRQRPGSTRRLKHNSRNTSMRRSSLRGEKSNLSKREAHEEALHFGLRLMQDEEELGVLDEEKENLQVTNVDDITITFDNHDKILPPSPNKSDPMTTRPNNTPPATNRSDQMTTRPNNTPPAANRSDQMTTRPTNNTTVLLPDKNADSKPSSSPVITRGSSTQDKPPAPSFNGVDKHSSLQEQSNKDKSVYSVDDHLQKMSLESVPQTNNRSSSASVISSASTQSQLRFYPPPMMEKARNGYNNPAPMTPFSRAASTTSQSSYREGQLRRFVAPPSTPAVGAEDEKNGCCVIL